MGKRGPKGKGPRERIEASVPPRLASVIDAAAAQSPYTTRNDFLVALFAEHFDQPDLKPRPTRVQREALDIPA